MKGSLQAALAGAPLDMAEAWGVAVRFAVHSLAHTHPAGLSAVLEVVMQPPPSGSYHPPLSFTPVFHPFCLTSCSPCLVGKCRCRVCVADSPLCAITKRLKFRVKDLREPHAQSLTELSSWCNVSKVNGLADRCVMNCDDKALHIAGQCLQKLSSLCNLRSANSMMTHFHVQTASQLTPICKQHHDSFPCANSIMTPFHVQTAS